MYDLIFLFLIFVLGSCWGSFLNVWIYRIPIKKSIASGRSACPKCNHTLNILDLFPVFSFLLLGGKCRYCKTKISWQYPLVELIVGVLFAITYIKFGLNPYLWGLSIFLITVNVVIGKIDWDTTLIPNVLIYPSIIISLIYSIYSTKLPLDNLVILSNPLESIIVSMALLGIFILLYFISDGGLGMGDAKYAMFIGLVFGKFACIVLLIATIGSVLYSGLIYLIFKEKIKNLPNTKISRKDDTEEPIEHKVLGVSIVNSKIAIVFGPFFAFSTLVIWFYGIDILNWYISKIIF